MGQKLRFGPDGKDGQCLGATHPPFPRVPTRGSVQQLLKPCSCYVNPDLASESYKLEALGVQKSVTGSLTFKRMLRFSVADSSMIERKNRRAEVTCKNCCTYMCVHTHVLHRITYTHTHTHTVPNGSSETEPQYSRSSPLSPFLWGHWASSSDERHLSQGAQFYHACGLY